MIVLDVKNLQVRRGGFEIGLPSLEVGEGAIVGLLGRSGSGKTSLLEAIAGFLPSTGSVRVKGKPVDALGPEKRAIAMVFQRPALFSHLTLAENIAFGLRVQKVEKAKRTAIAEKWLERIGMGGMGIRKSQEVSEGQAQRVALARALAVGFPVLLLDEPFSALDTQTRLEVGSLLSDLVKETKVAAVLVSHHADDLTRLTSSTLSLRAEGDL